jgi:hypothetical protein
VTSIAEDHERIRELLANYCFHGDSGRAQDYVELFSDDCVLDIGPYGTFEGKPALMQLQQRKGGKPASTRHFTTNIVIAVNGEEAQVKSYVVVINVGEQPPAIQFVGHYFDRLVKRNGSWKFQHRRVRTELSEAP